MTSCFHTGLCAEMREPNNVPARGPSPLLLDPAELLGECSLLPGLLPGLLDDPPGPPAPAPCPFALAALLLIAPRAVIAWLPSAASAVLDELRESGAAKPLTSLSDSSVGSRETNSFCSNCTTTYGRALDERTLRPRAWMSLTWICPLEGPAPLLGVLVPVAVGVVVPVPLEEDGRADLERPDGV